MLKPSHYSFLSGDSVVSRVYRSSFSGFIKFDDTMETAYSDHGYSDIIWNKKLGTESFLYRAVHTYSSTWESG